MSAEHVGDVGRVMLELDPDVGETRVESAHQPLELQCFVGEGGRRDGRVTIARRDRITHRGSECLDAGLMLGRAMVAEGFVGVSKLRGQRRVFCEELLTPVHIRSGGRVRGSVARDGFGQCRARGVELVCECLHRGRVTGVVANLVRKLVEQKGSGRHHIGVRRHFGFEGCQVHVKFSFKMEQLIELAVYAMQNTPVVVAELDVDMDVDHCAFFGAT